MRLHSLQFEKKKKLSDRKREYLKVYYKNNKEDIIAQMRRNYINNKIVVKERNKLYRLNHKERISERNKLYYLLNAPPRKFKKWTNPDVIKQFFQSARVLLSVSGPFDWYRISNKQIAQIGGGGLYGAFGSLGKALQFAFPDIKWDISKFSFRGKKSVQRWLRVTLEQLLPAKTAIFEDFLHPDLLWEKNMNFKMELDVWVPLYNLALEYQGEQHYNDLCRAFGPRGTLAFYKERDLKKMNACAERGITLVTIPYWWDGSKESLATTLHHKCPNLFHHNFLPYSHHRPTGRVLQT